jgi:uncharacterized protein YndB with AHSA1/START domain
MPDDNIIPFRRRRDGERPRLPAEWQSRWRLFWKRSLDRLEDYARTMREDHRMSDLKIEAVPGEPVLVMTRSFAAPRALVWKAMSQPEHLVRWFGPHEHINEVLEFDFRVGGKWRIRSTMRDNEQVTFFGEFREIEAPRLLTQTFAFDGLPEDAYSIDSVELIEQGDRTIYSARSIFPDIASRDGMLQSGMEIGVVEGFERLDAMLEAFKAEAV